MLAASSTNSATVSLSELLRQFADFADLVLVFLVLRQFDHEAAIDLQVVRVDVLEQLERIQARNRIARARSRSAVCLRPLTNARAGLRLVTTLASGISNTIASPRTRALFSCCAIHGTRVWSSSDCGVSLRKNVVRCPAFSRSASALIESPDHAAVDRRQQAVLFGNRHEEMRADVALRSVHAQQDFVVLALGAVQADDRLDRTTRICCCRWHP